jgi:S-adenosylmethionine hydrolase
MSDYGTTGIGVAVCKGALLKAEPTARIIDVTHAIPPYSRLAAAEMLADVTLSYPAGAIFVVVVEPSMGGKFDSVVAKSKKGQFFVLPDNGIITRIDERDGIEEVRKITNAGWTSPKTARAVAFGRDIFCPVAGRIARGDNWKDVGPTLPRMNHMFVPGVRYTQTGVEGVGISADPTFGNIRTSVDERTFGGLGYHLGDKVKLKVGSKEMVAPFVSDYSQVPDKEPLVILDPYGRIALAINHGSFAQKFGIVPPVPLEIIKH